jgi:hypothetical protein
MVVSCDLIKAYANQFWPQFQFADTERIFPVPVESWLQQCADGDWQNSTDPHRGTVALQARTPLQLSAIFPLAGCQGVTSSGPGGNPLDPTQPLPADEEGGADEFFIDFA